MSEYIMAIFLGKSEIKKGLPEGGRDRFCIDLVCVAGQPRAPHHASFDARSFQSVAPQRSGNEPSAFIDARPALGVLGVLVALGAVIAVARRRRARAPSPRPVACMQPPHLQPQRPAGAQPYQSGAAGAEHMLARSHPPASGTA